MQVNRLRLSNGRIIEGDALKSALDQVANDYEKNARAIRHEDPYASHVTEEEKDQALFQALDHAEKIRQGESIGFTTWQRINYLMTGESVAFLVRKG